MNIIGNIEFTSEKSIVLPLKKTTKISILHFIN